jgi:hypothetical protein
MSGAWREELWRRVRDPVTHVVTTIVAATCEICTGLVREHTSIGRWSIWELLQQVEITLLYVASILLVWTLVDRALGVSKWVKKVCQVMRKWHDERKRQRAAASTAPTEHLIQADTQAPEDRPATAGQTEDGEAAHQRVNGP